MSIWVLIQVVVNIFMMIGVSICLVRVFRTREDDPRLTQGLRLLQSKISILEDLSDHTENQVKQLMMLLDKKLGEVRGTIQEASSHIGEVDRSIKKSKEMAAIIQNEIPHDQIMEKRIESKYIQAAQLAHQGHTVDAIVQAVGLPKAEVELIAKINKKNCVYDRDRPENRSLQDEMFERSLEMPSIDSSSFEKTNVGFHQAVQEHKDKSEFSAVKLG